MKTKKLSTEQLCAIQGGGLFRYCGPWKSTGNERVEDGTIVYLKRYCFYVLFPYTVEYKAVMYHGR